MSSCKANCWPGVPIVRLIQYNERSGLWTRVSPRTPLTCRLSKLFQNLLSCAKSSLRSEVAIEVVTQIGSRRNCFMVGEVVSADRKRHPWH